MPTEQIAELRLGLGSRGQCAEDCLCDRVEFGPVEQVGGGVVSVAPERQTSFKVRQLYALGAV